MKNNINCIGLAANEGKLSRVVRCHVSRESPAEDCTSVAAGQVSSCRPAHQI